MVRINDTVYYSHGRTTRNVLDQLTSRRAFIYALEVFAQLMAVFLLADRLPREWVASSTTPGEAALGKGYGKDAFVMLSVFWNTAARRGWRPIFAHLESWRRTDDNVDRVVEILTWAASDPNYAAHHAIDALYQLAPEPA